MTTFSQDNTLWVQVHQRSYEQLLAEIDSGARDVDEVYEMFDETALFPAVRLNQPNLVYALLARHANLMALNHIGNTLLHEASSVGLPDMMALLLDAGIELKKPNNFGDTPRVYATAREEHRGDLLDVLNRYRDLPARESWEDVGKKELFSPTKSGYCLLDNPATWHQWPQVLSALEVRGEEIAIEDLLQPNKDGKTYLQRAVECLSFAAVHEGLLKQGYAIEIQHIMPDGKQLSPWAEKLWQTHQIAQLFDEKQWRGKRASEVQAVFRAVPKEQRNQITHYHGLLAKICQSRMVHENILY